MYNMQLSNDIAEELAHYLVANSKGAFGAVGFVSGGASFSSIAPGSWVSISFVRLLTCSARRTDRL